MPAFQITVVNDTFVSTNEQEFRDLDAAKRQGLKAALEVGVEQVLDGQPLFGAEVIIAHGNARERFIVTIGTSSLKE